MHDINKIRQEPDLFCDGLKKRGLKVDIEKILKIDSNLRESISEIQSFSLHVLMAIQDLYISEKFNLQNTS